MSHTNLPVSRTVQTDTGTDRGKLVPVTTMERMLLNDSGNISDRCDSLPDFTQLVITFVCKSFERFVDHNNTLDANQHNNDSKYFYMSHYRRRICEGRCDH